MKKIYGSCSITFKRLLFCFTGLFLLLIANKAHTQGCSSPSFGTATTYAAGTLHSNSVAISDVNGDGKADIVASYYYNVLVYINTGSGGFATPVSYTAGNDPFYVALGDLNGDGKPDLAVANEGSGNVVSVLLNNGNGTFGAATNYAVGQNSDAVAIGDLNGDGKPDLAVANYASNNVSVLFNNGNGTFAAATNYSAGTGIQGVVIGDVNSDGKKDLVATSYSTNQVFVLLNNGSGSFGSPTYYSVGTQPILLDIGDLNADGKPDLAVANAGSNSVSVLLNNGSGGFATASNYTVGNGPQAVAIGDLNGDGKPDLVSANYFGNNISLLLNNGNGSFGAATNYPAGTGATMSAIGDLNGDKKADLAVVNYTSDNLSVFMNTCSASNYILLPVSLTAVKAFEQNNGIEIEWSVTEEQEGGVFQVEKASENSDFQKIGEVQAIHKMEYSFFDKMPSYGKNYYRLKMIEQDGSFHYGPIVLVITGRSKGSVLIYPNPVSNHALGLLLKNQPAGVYTIQVFNSLGQRFLSKQITHSQGSSFETILLPENIVGGVYHVTVSSIEGRQYFDVLVQ